VVNVVSSATLDSHALGQPDDSAPATDLNSKAALHGIFFSRLRSCG